MFYPVNILLTVCVSALYGAELRDHRTLSTTSGSSLATPPALHDMRRASPLMRGKLSQPQLTSYSSDESLSSLDRNSIFELGNELRLGWLQFFLVMILYDVQH